MFLRSMLDNPLRIGAVAPSSGALARLIASLVRLGSGEAIVELGAGTGSVTRALLEIGVPRDRLYVIELDARLHRYLQNRFPGVTVLRGDAASARELLPPHRVGRISTVVSSLPLRPMRFATQAAIIDAVFDVLMPGGMMLQYSYPPGKPIPAARLGVTIECAGRIWMNLPPAAVWRLTRA
ncbi:MAG TPA: methyltransferase domain-containing protein [Candidatus Sulfotelmatobacter sp.]|nr:methyltransferase domain-containing protein [Candidatus Sulfotelmatobacter sp.]